MLGNEHHARRRRPEAILGIAIGIAAGVARVALTRGAEGLTTPHGLFQGAVTTGATAFFVFGLLSCRRWFVRVGRSRENPASSAPAHRAAIESATGGKRTEVLLDFETDALAVTRQLALRVEVVPYAEITSIHERRSWIELRFADGVSRVIPESYRAREDLLWAFAVHCNAAVERGIDLDATEAGAAERAMSAERAAAPSADAGPTSSGIAGLGSALADGAGRNPAPPRKSGLGVGLFPPQP